MKEQIKSNKKEIVEMLNKQVKDGIKVAKKLNVDDNVYGVVLTNLLNAHKSAEQMGAEVEFDEEQEKLNQEYKKKQSENKE